MGKVIHISNQGNGASNPVIELGSDIILDMNVILEITLEWNNQVRINPTYFTHVSGESEITIVQTGIYSISYKVAADTHSSGEENVVLIPKINDTDYILLGSSGTLSGESSNPLSAIVCPPTPAVALNAGDVLELTAARNGESGNVFTFADEGWIKIEKIS